MPRKHDSSRWREYYSAQPRRRTANPLLQKALRLVKKAPRGTLAAVDLGCGRGDDTWMLLEHGFRVQAIDAQALALRLLRQRIPARWKGRVLTRRRRFEELAGRDFRDVTVWNASYSLFFCRPSSFARTWKIISDSLVPGGVFCGHFIGVRDQWAKHRGISAVTKRELKQLFTGYKIVHFKEQEDDSGTITGKPKHWHLYSMVAVKKGASARRPYLEGRDVSPRRPPQKFE